ncbi:hypothetical protein [Nostoc sp.]|uniref:hypothetical protein n=1 Tax=Nostoc sp. TaxID=1180 RepID=UPI002FEECD8E
MAKVGVKPTRAYLLRLQVHASVSCIVASMRSSHALPCHDSPYPHATHFVGFRRSHPRLFALFRLQYANEKHQPPA